MLVARLAGLPERIGDTAAPDTECRNIGELYHVEPKLPHHLGDNADHEKHNKDIVQAHDPLAVLPVHHLIKENVARDGKQEG